MSAIPPPMAPEELALLSEPSVRRAIQAHAIAAYPHESCGIITRQHASAESGPGCYLPLENVEAENPDRAFNCVEQLAPHLVAGHVVAMVHSHPDGPEGPSSKDMRQQRAMAVPWGIVMSDGTNASEPYFWGDMLTPPPLEGRPFRHGPTGTDGKGDCGALVRDWYRIERGILINDYARDDEWWRHGQQLYLDNYLDAGFVLVDPNRPEIGDLILMAIRADTANHCAVYIGNHLIMHHLERRLSRVEPGVGWHRHHRGWLRHSSAPALPVA